MIEKFKTVKLSPEQMKKVKGGAECAHFGAFQTCLQSGQTYTFCNQTWCPYEE